MKLSRFTVLFGLFGLLSPLVYGEDIALPRVLDTSGFQEVLAVSGDIYIAGQPDEAGLARAKSLGVTTVINLRTRRETDNRNVVPYDEQATVATLEAPRAPVAGDGPDGRGGPVQRLRQSDLLARSQADSGGARDR